MNQDIQRVREIIQELPPELRTTLMLVRFEGMKYREAAEVQGLTLSTVRMQIHRSIQIIWERLKEN